jgi:hypothetical protein
VWTSLKVFQHKEVNLNDSKIRRNSTPEDT